MNFQYITKEEDLTKASEEWNKAKIIAVDIECENNLHHFGTYISLIQLSAKTGNWIVDVLQLKKIAPLIKLLENPQIEKIFHDVSFDFRILQHQFKVRPKNIFDTQIAALLLGKKEIGLGSLLQDYLQIKKECKYQMADWTLRPLTTGMLEYAIKDTLYLIFIKDILEKELQKLNRLSWAQEEFAELEKKNWEFLEGNYDEISGFRSMTPQQRSIFKKLFFLRQETAHKVDRPVHFIMSNKLMLKLATNPPRSLSAWKEMKQVHPIVRNFAPVFYQSVLEAGKEEINLELKEKKRYTLPQKEELERLDELRTKIAQELNLQKYLILNQDQMQDIVLTGTKRSLRYWQKKLIEEKR